MSWDPRQYNRFADERAAPLGELLSRIPAERFADILDLGCGNGVAIPLIRARWPEAAITALDNSPEMLEAAGNRTDSLTRFIQADITQWSPDRKFQLIVSNAALHWLDDHEGLFPRLMEWLAPGGILAVQMPYNWAEPSHRLMIQAAENGPWKQKLAPLLRPTPVGSTSFYQALLEPLSQSCDVWEQVFTHNLDGEDAVFNWIKGTSLKPLLDALEIGERVAFAANYKAALNSAYPGKQSGGTTFPFHRLFIMAVRKD